MDFKEQVEELRKQLVGRKITVHSDIPMVPTSGPQTGVVVALHITEGEKIDIELARPYRREGVSLPLLGEKVRTGRNIIGLKVDVIAGRCDRWIELRE